MAFRLLEGTIANLWTQIHVIVRTTNFGGVGTGDILDDQQCKAGQQKHPGRFDSACPEIAMRLGESLPSVEKLPTPLARGDYILSSKKLEGFSQGWGIHSANGESQKALSTESCGRDRPQFATAYTVLSVGASGDIGDLALCEEIPASLECAHNASDA